MIDSCDWQDPGRDAYMGTPRAAIMAMAEIPRPVRLALVARAEAHDYDDTVYIDRDSIRSSKHAYSPDIRSMAFGSLGRTCRTVTRSRWSDSRIEAAWVYCDSGWCVAMPAVCRNWAIVTRYSDAAGVGRGSESPVAALDEPTTVLIADPQTAKGAIEPHAAMDASDGAWSVGPAFNTFNGSAGYAYGGTSIQPLPHPVVAVAEPSTYALMLAGLVAVVMVRRCKA